MCAGNWVVTIIASTLKSRGVDRVKQVNIYNALWLLFNRDMRSQRRDQLKELERLRRMSRKFMQEAEEGVPTRRPWAWAQLAVSSESSGSWEVGSAQTVQARRPCCEVGPGSSRPWEVMKVPVLICSCPRTSWPRRSPGEGSTRPAQMGWPVRN